MLKDLKENMNTEKRKKIHFLKRKDEFLKMRNITEMKNILGLRGGNISFLPDED